MPEAVQRAEGWAPRYRDPNTGRRAVIPGSDIYDTWEEAMVASREFEEALRNLEAEDWFDPRTTTLWMYIEHCIAAMRKARKPQAQTVLNYEREAKRLIRPFPIADKLMVNITRDDLLLRWWDDGVLVKFEGMIPTQEAAKRTMYRFVNIAHPSGHMWKLREVPMALIEPQAHNKVKQRRRRHRLTEEEYEQLLATGSPESHLMWIETAGESGCRPEEVHALAPEQFLWGTNELYVDRAVVWLSKKDAERINGGETVSVSIVKDTETRTVPMAPEYMARMKAFIQKHGIRDGELIFSRTRMGVGPASRRLPWVDVSEGTEWVRVTHDRRGRRYESHFRHGTPHSYGAGKCRCDLCTAAVRQVGRTPEEEYKERTSDGRILARTPQNDACPNQPWLRRFRAVFVRAGIDWKDVEPYDMRHAHAIWLAYDPDMTPEELMQRLGHVDYATTKGYIDEARDAQKSAAVKNRSRRYRKGTASEQPALTKAEILAKINELTAQLV